jgi:hypothetical protein
VVISTQTRNWHCSGGTVDISAHNAKLSTAAVPEGLSVWRGKFLQHEVSPWDGTPRGLSFDPTWRIFTSLFAPKGEYKRAWGYLEEWGTNRWSAPLEVNLTSGGKISALEGDIKNLLLFFN